LLEFVTQSVYAGVKGVAGHLLWLVPVIAVLVFAEYRWAAGAHPSIAARVGNMLMAIVAILLIPFVNPLIEAAHRWLPANSLLTMAFGDWKPDGVLGLGVSTLVFVFIWDFFQYWFHRAEHAFPFLWPVHALHHEDENMNATTSQRNTVWSAILHAFFVLIPSLMVFGVDLPAFVGMYLFFTVYGPFNHANVRLNLGWLTPVVSGPQWHRLHHGRDSSYYDKNFAAFFPVLDVVFGTYRAPARDEYPATGLADRPQALLRPMPLLRDAFGLGPARPARD
jgi:sterol desaturase/sphingolipid hydroxylase (fatty acid hydroxylase superfamily)